MGSGQNIAVIEAPLDADLREVASSLQISLPSPVLALSGGAPASGGDFPAPQRNLAAVIAEAVKPTGAIVLDGRGCLREDDALRDGLGTRDVMVRLACRTRAPAGPSPADATPDGPPADTPGGPYTHLVLAEAETEQDETHLLPALGQAVAQGMPMALLLVGGDSTALAQTAAALECGFRVFVAVGSGGTADRIAAAMRSRSPVDPAVEMIASPGRAGDSHVVLAEAESDVALTWKLVWALHPDLVLKDAWQLFTTMDRAAVRLRTRFELFQATILLLGLLATLLAVLDNQLGTRSLRWAVVVASIAVAAVTALSGRRAAGKRWIVTRAAAESVKSEIFRYRTRTGRYADGSLRGRDPARRPGVLAAQLGEIERRLMHTEVGNSALPTDQALLPTGVGHTGDDGLAPLPPEQYIALRIDDQLRYYHRRLRDYDRRRQALQGIAVAASSAGALVAALGGEVWVALTSALAAAPLAYLAHLQVEKTIVAYNQSVARLDDVLRRWHGRAAHLPSRQSFGRLVIATEAILTSEHGAWVEEMTEAMHHLDDADRVAGPREDPQR